MIVCEKRPEVGLKWVWNRLRAGKKGPIFADLDLFRSFALESNLLAPPLSLLLFFIAFLTKFKPPPTSMYRLQASTKQTQQQAQAATWILCPPHSNMFANQAKQYRQYI